MPADLREMRHGGWRVGALVVSVALLAGCDSERERPRVDEPDPGGAAAATASLHWNELGTWRDGPRPAAVSRHYLAVTSQNDDRVTVHRRADSTVALTYVPPEGELIAQTHLDGDQLIVVLAGQVDQREDEPVRIDVADGTEQRLDEGAPVPSGGAWSVGSGRLTYGTSGPEGRDCLASAELSTMRGDVVECFEPRHSATQVNPTPYGLGYVVSDGAEPHPCASARIRRDDAAPTALAGVASCQAWQALPAADGTDLWSVIPAPEEMEKAEVHVRGDGQRARSLGPATAGSLVWCGDALWFTRHHEGRVLRWSAAKGLETVFRGVRPAAGGVVSAPRCGGDAVAVTETRTTSDAYTQETLHVTDLG